MRCSALVLALVAAMGVSSVAEASELGFEVTQSAWVGPQWNMHFGAEQTEYSIGLEASYWKSLD